MSFTLFPNLPKELRLLIWDYVASIPRVVEIHEDHRDPIADAWAFGPPENNRTVMRSKTRPPAMLEACSEARSHGLKIYVSAYKELNSQHRGLKCPIYVNPAVDITYRDFASCLEGDGFSIRCRNWEEETEPLCCTKSLAVDIVALQLAADTLSMSECARDLCAALRKGVDEVILVVGNTDGISEFSLVAQEEPWENRSPLAIKAEELAEKFRKATAAVIASSAGSAFSDKTPDPEDQSATVEKSAIQMPVIKLMTVQRAPLQHFPQFKKLPFELQDLIWKFANGTPRVLDVLEDHGILYCANRQPALFNTCRASREVVKRTMIPLHLPGSDPWDESIYYNPRIDIVHLPLLCDMKQFAKLGIRKVGISFDSYDMGCFGGGEVKKLGNDIDEVVILVGNRLGYCEMTVSDDVRGHLNARCFSHELWREVQNTARRWRNYQRAREKKGKASPDWIPPLVRVAKLENVSETVIPYDYKVVQQRLLPPSMLHDWERFSTPM